MTSKELARMVSGVAKFQADVFPARRLEFEALSNSKPEGHFFHLRRFPDLAGNAAADEGRGDFSTNARPATSFPATAIMWGMTASMEYAVMVLRVPLIISAAITDCGVMKALLDPGGPPECRHSNWMRHALAAREQLLREHPDVSHEEKLRLITQFDVLTQLENLRSHPAVEAALAKGTLEIQGWIYDIGGGSVSVADPQSGAFHSLTPPAGTKQYKASDSVTATRTQGWEGVTFPFASVRLTATWVASVE